MLHRSTSSRRRRASRSAASPSIRGSRSAGTSPGRRASIAVSPVDSESVSKSILGSDLVRSPRASIIPDISFDSRNSSTLDNSSSRSPRHSLVPESALSPRNSLVPDLGNLRSPRHSLVPGDNYLRSPRSSLVPESALNPRNSLVPDTYNRSPRNSLVPENVNKSPRNSLVPDSSQNHRHSLVPDNNTHSSRLSLAPDFNRSPRNSLVPDTNRSQRPSLTPSESTTWNTKTSPNEESCNRNANRSPRGSIAPDSFAIRNTPRGSISSEYPYDRSPRGSIGPENNINRSPRGSIAPPRNNLAADFTRSPRGSLTLTFQEPLVSERRSSADNPSGSRCRSTSPYRSSSRGVINQGYNVSGYSEGGSRRASSSVSQVKKISLLGGKDPSDYISRATNKLITYRFCGAEYSYIGKREKKAFHVLNLKELLTNCTDDQMQIASMVKCGLHRIEVGLPQVSGDEQRRLCSDQKYGIGEQGLGLGISLTTYGSVAYQLKDANLEATSTCDFVCKAITIVNRTVVVTIVLICLSTLPLLMLIMGIQFLRDCPREPHIPVYMVVGGSIGCIKMAWILWDQLRIRRIEDGSLNATSIGSKVASFGLTIFLIAWFALGNYWILRIKWPDYSPTLFEPNRWCHRTLYVFSLVHLCVIYSVIGLFFGLVITLAGCQLFGSPWLGPTRYK